jgi:benzoylformate decarboxylase
MPFMSGKQTFLEILRAEGVRVIFGNPGTTELPLMEALAATDAVKYVLGLQEAVALAMAGGYGLASHELAVVSVHAAPGLGNAMGMLYDARKAGVPMLVIAGQHDQGFRLTEPVLWADLTELARPLVKWSYEVQSLAELPRVLHRAAKTAFAPPSGPVFLALPGDVLNAQGEIEIYPPTRLAPRLRADRDAILAAAERIAAAERPVIVAGDAVEQGDAHADLIELAETAGAAVFTECIANTMPIAATHPLARGPLGRMASHVQSTLSPYDLIVSIGADLFTVTLPMGAEPLPPGVPVIHLDSDPWEIGKNHATAVALLGDVKATLPELIDALKAAHSDEQRRNAEQRLTRLREQGVESQRALRQKAAAMRDGASIRPLALYAALSDVIPDDAIIVEEAISAAPGVREFLVRPHPHSFFGLRGGGIGWGMAAAAGIKLASPNRPVIALIGDGSALYTPQVLWTVAHERLPVVYLILNNRSYHILKQRSPVRAGADRSAFVGMDITDPPIDFVDLARSFGVPAARASTIDDAMAALQAALASAKPFLIDVLIDSGP